MTRDNYMNFKFWGLQMKFYWKWPHSLIYVWAAVTATELSSWHAVWLALLSTIRTLYPLQKQFAARTSYWNNVL